MPVSTIAPDQRFFAIGDIHGRLDLLQSLMSRLESDCPLVFAGDYIDRGAHSAEVLRLLHHLSLADDRSVFCLQGNHEDMLLSFLDNPEQVGPHWLRNGGAHTLASFGISGVDTTLMRARSGAIARRLRQAMGQELLVWLRERPLTWTSGNVTVVHAGLDPTAAVDDQLSQVCLWGHPKFFRQRRQDGQWVVHGHTIVESPQVHNGVVSIDTGAFFSGRLTAAEIRKENVRFISTEIPPG
ncbi:metallophosphoesterase family protein [Ruegeria lacuscaerulensis]|uniref:metallophosphoesterase family protein n=1 Tax=Ruegeria lacuscaerulensis TaxID=55218 RepID=UPI001F249715|nr:metallophosphoesterase family protein [Ruegeria lacuscaerulensis]